MDDPRPLVGEPLPLDLVDTEWIEGGRRRDLLTDLDGMRAWLRSAGRVGAPVDHRALTALRKARHAIRATAERRDDPDAREQLNAVLDHGRVSVRLADDGPVETLEVKDERWRVPWLAAREFLRLLDDHGDRVRKCANPDCILHFHDTSRSGRRQWCSMAVCGNRVKARRHYARTRTA